METLTALLEQAEAERNLALAAFNQMRARCDAARAQAAQLNDHRAEYQLRWSAQFTRGAALEIVRCYQGFARRLDAAIAQQAHAVALAQGAQARAGDTLTAHELRVASVRKLIERRMDGERRVAARHEQRNTDEAAMRMAQWRSDSGFGQRGVRA
jgi:flagellar FliJ protein